MLIFDVFMAQSGATLTLLMAFGSSYYSAEGNPAGRRA